METKVCTKCGEEKEVGEFHKNNRNKNGLQTRCKDCRAEVAKEYGERAEVKEKNKENARRFRAKIISAVKEVPDEKLCLKCGESKNWTDFHKNNGSKDGLRNICKKCAGNYQREHKKEHNERNKKYKDKNRDSVNAKNREYYSRPEVKRKRAEYTFEYYRRNIGRYNEWHRNYRSLDEVKEYKKNWVKEKIKTNIKYRLHYNFSSLLRISLAEKRINKNYNKTFDIVGYTIEQLKEHLEKQFEPWMNWNNHGLYRLGGEKKWHIDHIRPRSSFNFASIEDEEFKKCWALENLRPLEAVENMKKGDKYNELA